MGRPTYKLMLQHYRHSYTVWKGIYKKIAPTASPTGSSAYLLHGSGLVFTYSEVWIISEQEVIEAFFQAPLAVQTLENNGANKCIQSNRDVLKTVEVPSGLKPQVLEATSFCKTCFLQYWTLQGLALISSSFKMYALLFYVLKC